ncbi:MAG TPA: ATP-binding protein, partial [Gemmatimonadales bacterium]|nr:ATP-binding protein [Gemmatimonadales bacterium]
EGGVVRVTVGTTPGVITFTVENDGPGIDPDDAERIFDIYVTKPGDESRSFGLGLPLSRRLARLLGGELRALPQASGGCFLLELPAADPS